METLSMTDKGDVQPALYGIINYVHSDLPGSSPVCYSQ